MKYYGIDLLRGIAAFGIVGCHLSLGPRTGGGEWMTALCNFNVGLFAAIAGFLMSFKGGGLEYVKKRAGRLLPTYLGWTAIYVVATAIYDLSVDGGCLDARYYRVSNWINVLFFGSAAAHLWFLVCLFYGQVVLQGVDKMMAGAKITEQMRKALFAGLSLGMLAISCMGGNWWCLYPARLMAFLLLGYGLKGLKVNRRWGLGIVTVIMLIVHLLGRGVLPGFVRDYMLSIPVLMLFANGEWKESRISTWLAATSMGVYLIHPLFARGVSFGLTRMLPPPYNAWIVVGEWVVVWMLALGLVALMQKMPMTARWVR